MTEPSQPGTEIEVGANLPPELVQQFASMAILIPSEGTDAVESILSQILNAPDWDALDDPWESSKVDALTGRTLCVNDVIRRPSDFKDGLGIFLVVYMTDVKTGESLVWTTSSFSCVAQLTRAYVAGWLPALVQVIVAERPTKSGYRPHHLKFVGRPGSTKPKTAQATVVAEPADSAAQTGVEDEEVPF